MPNYKNKCPYCGALLDSSNDLVCKNCNTILRTPTKKDKNGKWGYMIGFIAPPIGFILYITKKTESPKMAKAALKGAIISIVLAGLLMSILSVWYFTIYLPNLLATIGIV